jgi:hypothetical protein
LTWIWQSLPFCGEKNKVDTSSSENSIEVN